LVNFIHKGGILIITYQKLENTQYGEWLEHMSDYLQDNWGLQKEFSQKMAVFILYNYMYGNPVVKYSSGYRDPDKQKELLRRWNEGDREGLAFKPAVNSKHTMEGWFGTPASQALDMRFKDQNLAGRLAPYFGIRWGGSFGDDVHFDAS
jgi:hypothetical protein